MTEPMVIVRVIGGPRCGERFATPLNGLTEGFLFRYMENHYEFVQDAQSGRWAAILVTQPGHSGRAHG